MLVLCLFTYPGKVDGRPVNIQDGEMIDVERPDQIIPTFERIVEEAKIPFVTLTGYLPACGRPKWVV